MAIINEADLKSHLNIPDTEDDASLTTAVEAACQDVTEWCGAPRRDFTKTELVGAAARVFRPEGPYLCHVDDFWETTALVVKTDETDDGTYETTWTATTDFIVEPANASAYSRPYTKIIATGNRLFPCRWSMRLPVQVTAAWGWSSVPANVKQATLIHAARLFGRRYSRDGVIGGQSELGPIRVSSRIDPDVQQLLTRFRHPDAVALVG